MYQSQTHIDQTLNQMMENAPIIRAENRLKESVIVSAFSRWIQSSTFHEWHLSLYKFAIEKPLCHINLTVIDETLRFFNLHPSLVLEAIINCGVDISHAVLSLIRPGSSWGKDEQLSLDTPKDLVEFESVWHPEYLRYCEQIYNHLIQIPLTVLGQLNGGKQYISQTLANRSSTLASMGFKCLTDGFNSTIRNALSHGHILFGVQDITYTDHQKVEKILSYDFSNTFDNLVDTCNSLVVTILIFLCENRSLVEQKGLYSLPVGIRFFLIDGFTQHRDLRLLSMIENQIIDNKRQLNLICEVGSKVRAVHLFSATFLCWAACRLGGKDYNRYVISIDCGMPSLPMMIYNGEQMSQAIENDLPLVQCGPKLIESSLLWYDKPGIVAKISTFRNIFSTNFLLAKRQFIANIENAGFTLWSRHYLIVNVNNTSPRKFRRIEAHIILRHDQNPTTAEFLTKIIIHAIRNLRTKMVKVKDIDGEKGFLGRPFFITVRLYSQERRLRKLKSYSWQDKELVLIAEWSRDWKTAPPFYTRDAQIVKQGIRVKLNDQLMVL
ncbi:MAG: hypothetical protein ACOYYS_19325 [Chloroflexota bacterium]